MSGLPQTLVMGCLSRLVLLLGPALLGHVRALWGKLSLEHRAGLGSTC